VRHFPGEVQRDIEVPFFGGVAEREELGQLVMTAALTPIARRTPLPAIACIRFRSSAPMNAPWEISALRGTITVRKP
jgi:hypothetical protein